MNYADKLVALLEADGAAVDTAPGRPTALEHFSTDLAARVLETYGALGGRGDRPTLRPGAWDIGVDGVMVELDEHLHFNRYRAATLRSDLYKELPRFPLATFRSLCEEHESACLRAGSYGGKWSNTSCERMFGPAGAKGNLSGPGAPRWRQRALYDHMKDLMPLHDGTQVARLAIWEEVPGTNATLHDILSAKVLDPARAASVRALVSARAEAGRTLL